jgi:hypothetical protein
MASNFASPGGRSFQRRVECVQLLSSQLPSLWSSTTSISCKYLSLEALAELGREFPFVKQLPRKLALEAPNNVFSDDRQELESTRHDNVSLDPSNGSLLGSRTVRFLQ